MSDVKCAQALLEAAEQDINALRALLDAAGVGDGVFGFHVQQAAEKSFKAWLALLGVKFPLTHDLGGLAALLDEKVDAAAFHPLRAYTPLRRAVSLSGVGSGHANRPASGVAPSGSAVAARHNRAQAPSTVIGSPG